MPESSNLRIGLFGGTFNPIHNGHLSIIEFAQKNLNLNKLIIIPAGKPPHKNQLNQDVESYKHRMAMIKIAINQKKKQIPEIEISKIDHPCEIKNFNWTYLLLKKIRQQYLKDDLLWLMGMDSFLALPSWKNWQKLVKMCNFVVFNRIENDTKSNTNKQEVLETIKNVIRNKNIQEVKINYPYGEFEFVNFPIINITGSDIRQKLKINDLNNLKEIIPQGVLNYIFENNLYQRNTAVF